jgi:arylsulfatase A-like enzyme
MENHAIRPDGGGRERSGIVLRFFVASVAAGLAVGIFEASLLWTSPRVAALLTRDVRYVIWFLAPLVDMLFFGLVGLAPGWLAGRTRFLQLAIAVQSGFTVAFVALTWQWFHREIALQSFSFHKDFLVPLAWFSAGFAAALAVLFLMRLLLQGSFTRPQGALLKPLAWVLAAAAVVAGAGVITFAIRPSWRGASVRAAANSAPQAPNIVFITLDTVRADHLSSYGYSRPTTPKLDRLARSGVLFENAISPTSWTLASHASMFTGLLPHQHGAGYDVPMPRGARTLAEILRSRGYETAGFTSNFHYLEKGWGLARGFKTYQDNSASLRHNLAQTFVGSAIIQPVYQNLVCYDDFNRLNARELNQDVFNWFRRRSTRPFFLFINYLDAHEPYLAPPPDDRRFGTVPMSLVHRLHHASSNTSAPPHFTAGERASLIAAYDNCIAYLDGQVGRLLRFLRRSPEWKNTVVIITSDHGEEFGGHGHYSHGKDLYRAALDVPLIIAGPGVPSGLRIRHVVATQQIFSTVLDLAGHTPFSRYSLARFWNPEFKPQPFDDVVLSELAFPWYWRMKASTILSATTPRWQYIDDSTGHPRLFRWTDDPRETTNLAASAEGQAVVKNLQGRLRETVRNSVTPWRGADYLLHLGGQTPFLAGVLLSRPSQPRAPGGALRVGASQAYFNSPQAWAPPRLSPSQRDLMRSLPYQ